MKKRGYSFQNFPDCLIYLIIMFIPFMYSYLENEKTGNHDGVKAIMIFAVITSGYYFAKIITNEGNKGIKLILIPSMVALVMLTVVLSLVVASIAKNNMENIKYASYLYLAHLLAIILELMRIAIETLKGEERGSTLQPLLKAGAQV